MPTTPNPVPGPSPIALLSHSDQYPALASYVAPAVVAAAPAPSWAAPLSASAAALLAGLPEEGK